MENTLSLSEKEQLKLIADALQRNLSLEADEQVLSSLIRKCLVRTNGKTLKLTEQGKRALAN